MKRCLAPFLGLLLGACATSATLPAAGTPATVREPFHLKLPRYPSGASFDVAQEKGRVVLLDVWATWCEPCKDALPVYAALAQRYAARGLSVYTINVDTDAAAVGEFLTRLEVNLPVLLDKDALVAERDLHVRVMPTAFLVDRKGMLRHVHEGFSEDFQARYETEIQALLAEAP